MGATKFVKFIYAVICLIFFISVVNCYGANKKAEEFYEQGKKLSTVENAAQAIDIYNKAIKLDPKMVKAYNNRGIAYVWIKKYDLALADFNKAIALDPKNGKAYNNRAIVYSYQGETVKARQDLHKAQSLGVTVNPDFLKRIEALPSTPESIFHKTAPPAPETPAKK
jgi:tetratricopeptide (TPR) repeat protein